jgi:DNA-binding MarR family transcriptional regulator
MRKEKTLTEETRTLGALLRLPFQELSRRVYGQMAACGFEDIREAHGAVFRYILPGGSRVTDLADRSHITKQSMAYLVEYLEARGYVEMAPDPDDRRARLVRLTERGKAAQETARRLSGEVERAWAVLIGGREMAELRSLLESLCDHLYPE